MSFLSIDLSFSCDEQAAFHLQNLVSIGGIFCLVSVGVLQK